LLVGNWGLGLLGAVRPEVLVDEFGAFFLVVFEQGDAVLKAEFLELHLALPVVLDVANLL
jgi:hypothetical protein